MKLGRQKVKTFSAQNRKSLVEALMSLDEDINNLTATGIVIEEIKDYQCLLPEPRLVRRVIYRESIEEA